MIIKKSIYAGVIVDEKVTYSLKEVCETCGVHAECVIEMVEFGILEPKGKDPKEWIFSVSELLRFKKALRMRRDLDINLSGLSLALNLLEENEKLRSRVKWSQQLLEGFRVEARKCRSHSSD